jgi:glutathione S-transferase
MSSTPIRLFDFALSGHAHRVRLMLSLLDLPVELVPVALAAGEQKAPAFLTMNPFGQVPVIQDGDVTLGDSNAILVYLARRYDSAERWLPATPLAMAQVQVWLSAAAGPLTFGPAHLRAGHVFKRPIEARAQALTTQLLAVMSQRLADHAWLASAEHPTIADVAMYSYTAHAPEGGISLDAHPALQRWLARVEGLTGFVPMPASAWPGTASAPASVTTGA